jgi:hypothetical protein
VRRDKKASRRPPRIPGQEPARPGGVTALGLERPRGPPTQARATAARQSAHAARASPRAVRRSPSPCAATRKQAAGLPESRDKSPRVLAASRPRAGATTRPTNPKPERPPPARALTPPARRPVPFAVRRRRAPRPENKPQASPNPGTRARASWRRHGPRAGATTRPTNPSPSDRRPPERSRRPRVAPCRSAVRRSRAPRQESKPQASPNSGIEARASWRRHGPRAEATTRPTNPSRSDHRPPERYAACSSPCAVRRSPQPCAATREQAAGLPESRDKSPRVLAASRPPGWSDHPAHQPKPERPPPARALTPHARRPVPFAVRRSRAPRQESKPQASPNSGIEARASWRRRGPRCGATTGRRGSWWEATFPESGEPAPPAAGFFPCPEAFR